MSKERAIQIIKEDSVSKLIETLMYDGLYSTAMDIIDSCWGDDADVVIDHIENNWNF